jgi:single stranded DNA-binding protein
LPILFLSLKSAVQRSSGYLKGVADISDGVFFVVVEGLGNPQLSAGQAFGLATNRSWQSYDAQEKHEETEFHRIVAWDKLAETCHQFLRKGRKVHIEGRLHTRVYTDKDDVKREVTEIVLEELVMLDKVPDAVKESLDLKDQSNGHQAQQV